MKKITYLIILISFTLFSCKTTKIVSNKTFKIQIKSIKEILSKPNNPINKSLKSNRDSVFSVRYDTYQVFSKNGMLIESVRYERDGSLYEKTKSVLNKNGKLIKGVKYNSKGEVKEKWKYIYKENITEIDYYDSKGNLTNKQVDVSDDKGNNIEMSLINTKRNSVWKYVYAYNEKSEIIERLKYKPDGSLKDKRTYKYDEKGNKIEEYLYRDEKVTKFISEYDKMNNMLVQNWFNEKGERTHQTSFEYVYDVNRNWITKKRSSNGVLGMIWERNIKYYE